MKVYDAPNIRNVAVVGHGGCGKTSLVSALLFDAGAVNRIGRVDEGTTVTDFDPDEIERKISLLAALAFARVEEDQGQPDRRARLRELPVGGARGAARGRSGARRGRRGGGRRGADAEGLGLRRGGRASAADRRQPHGPRQRLVRARARRNPEVLRPLRGADRDPGRRGKAFKGVVDLVAEKAHLYADDASGKFQTGETPAAQQETAKAWREKLVEMVAESNEELMEEFFEKGTLSQEQLAKGLRTAVGAGRVFPVLPASSLLNVGVHPILDALVDLLPSPADRGEVEGLGAANAPATRKPAADAPPSAFVWKTLVDPHAGRISLFRVYSGTLKSDSAIHNATRDVAERFGSLLLLQGKAQTQVPEIQAGDIGAVAKLKETQTGDTLADKAHPITYPKVVFPEPATTFAIEPKTRGDEDKISTALQRLLEEDPVLRVSRDAQTHEMLLSGMGQLHIEVVVGRLRKRYKVEVNLKKPKIPYRETIKGAAEGHGRHKKQTGGHGQFGDCKIRMKPLARGEDFKFVDDIFGGSIPRNFIPAVEKGIQDARLKGVICRLPDGRLPGRALRRLLPRRRQLRDVVQDRGLARLQGRRAQVPPHDPRAGHEASRSPCPTSTRAR